MNASRENAFLISSETGANSLSRSANSKTKSPFGLGSLISKVKFKSMRIEFLIKKLTIDRGRGGVILFFRRRRRTRNAQIETIVTLTRFSRIYSIAPAAVRRSSAVEAAIFAHSFE